MPESDYIRLEDVTKDYGEGRGNFHVDLSVKKGETLGIVGENGAGKTTLMRQLMGFISSDEGFITIDGMDAYLEAQKTKRLIGYIPGEINFPDVKSGTAFLHSYGDALGAKEEDYAYANEPSAACRLDIRAYPKRMSKGMKQKTSIVAAFMRRPSILFLDEPSIGLDPLMREEPPAHHPGAKRARGDDRHVVELGRGIGARERQGRLDQQRAGRRSRRHARHRRPPLPRLQSRIPRRRGFPLLPRGSASRSPASRSNTIKRRCA